MSPPLVELQDIRKSYQTGDAPPVEVLRGITLTIRPGEFVAIVGASGSGKSTLMNVLGGLDQPDSGSYRFLGTEVTALDPDELASLRRRSFGFVFQHYHLIPAATALGNVEMPAVYAGMPPARRRARALALLDRLGLGGHRDHRPSQLSGGQQQRVSIARALMNGGQMILADEPTGALDSRTGDAVVALLRELAEAGHAVVLITHDPKVARAAGRVVEIADGRIVRDRGAAATSAPVVLPRLAEDDGATLLADMGEAIHAARQALSVNSVRTMLTLLGMVIGVAAVVALLAIGEGARQRVVDQMSALGPNIIYMSGAQRSPSTPAGVVTLDDVRAVGELPLVESVMPVISGEAILRFGNRSVVTYTLGTNTELPPLHHWPIEQGIFFTDADQTRLAAVLVLGQKVKAKLFDDADPIGRHVLVDNVPFLVIGVLAPKGAASGQEDLDDLVVMPYETASARIYGRRQPNYTVIGGADVTRMAETEAAIRQLMLDRHGAEDFATGNAAAQIEAQARTQATMSLMLGAVAAISMLVGGIGIMNIMLMTVTERTREIGIRMAMGARVRDIQRQFLIEAIVLSSLGGIAGVLVGGLAGLTGAMAGVPVIFDLWPTLLAFASALAAGLTFGFVPARKAALMRPVEALAHL